MILSIKTRIFNITCNEIRTYSVKYHCRLTIAAQDWLADTQPADWLADLIITEFINQP